MTANSVNAKRAIDARSKYKRERNATLGTRTRCVGQSVTASRLDEKLKHHGLVALCDAPRTLVLQEKVVAAQNHPSDLPSGLYYKRDGGVVSHVDAGAGGDVDADDANHPSGSPRTPTSLNNGANDVPVGAKPVAKVFEKVHQQSASLQEENDTLRMQCSSLQSELERALAQEVELSEKYEALRIENEELNKKLREIKSPVDVLPRPKEKTKARWPVELSSESSESETDSIGRYVRERKRARLAT